MSFHFRVPVLFLVSVSVSVSVSLLSVVALGATLTHLPGFDGPLPFHLETGYVEVDEVNGVELFYYFIESERKPEEDPLLVWLTGGPGCSGFSGLAFEIGPLNFDVAGYNEGRPSLIYNPFSWTKVSSIIFLDSPVGTGFSYSKLPEGYETGDSKSVTDVYMFIRKWVIDHPKFLSNPLYVGGDSYSGMTVPIVAQEIANGYEETHINFKGYLVGNPVTDPKFDGEASVPYAHGMGLISDELYKAAELNCRGKYTGPRSARCATSLQSIDECLQGLNTAHFLEPICFLASPKPRKFIVPMTRMLVYYDEILPLSKSHLPLECRSSGYLLSSYWANNDTVQEALGIHKGSIKEWKRCNFGAPYTHDVESSVDYHLNLTLRGYRALVYSGDHDMVVPNVGTQAWIRSFNFPIVDDWRSWSVNGQIAGFTRTYANNLTFATVKGAGHTAPEYKPKECQAMLDRWLSHVPL